MINISKTYFKKLIIQGWAKKLITQGWAKKLIIQGWPKKGAVQVLYHNLALRYVAAVCCCYNVALRYVFALNFGRNTTIIALNLNRYILASMLQ